MSEWGISEYSGVITPAFFIVLLVVLWKVLRSITGLYTVMVYNNDQIKSVSEMIERLLDEDDSMGSEGAAVVLAEAKRSKKAPAATQKAPKPPKPASTPAPPTPEPAATDERRLFVVPTDDSEQTKRKILSSLRQQPGLGYSGLAEKLGITVAEAKALCAELEREGKIAGRR